MATSLLSRAFLSRQTRRLCTSLYSSPFRSFSSKQDDFKTSVKQDSADKVNLQQDKTSDASYVEQPVIDNVEVTSTKGLSPKEEAVDKFFKVVEKVTKSQKDSSSDEPGAVAESNINESFATMFRMSKFVSLGEFKGRLVEGKIFEVMDDDLYIDFGGKFHCVCPRPKRNPDKYHRGTTVLVNLQAMEMSSAFLGSDIHVTLLEGDGTLIGLAASSRSLGADSLK